MRLMLVLSVLWLCACGPPPSPRPGSAAPSQSSEATQATGLAADEAPDYTGSTPVDVPNLGAAGNDSRSGRARAMETDDSPAQVAAFYRDHFQRAGIPVRVDTATDAGGLIAAGRDGGRGVMVTISRIAGKTRIAVIQHPPGP